MDQVARMAFLRQQLHKTVFAVAGVQPEHRPCQQTAGYGPERDAYPLVHACQVRMTTARSTVTRPPAKTNRYCDLSPLNSTGLPAPLFTEYSIPLRGRRNAGWWRLQSERCRQRTSWRRFSRCRDHRWRTCRRS